jgi:hypothetical protein
MDQTGRNYQVSPKTLSTNMGLISPVMKFTRAGNYLITVSVRGSKKNPMIRVNS